MASADVHFSDKHKNFETLNGLFTTKEVSMIMYMYNENVTIKLI